MLKKFVEITVFKKVGENSAFFFQIDSIELSNLIVRALPESMDFFRNRIEIEIYN